MYQMIEEDVMEAILYELNAAAEAEEDSYNPFAYLDEEDFDRFVEEYSEMDF